MLSRSWSWSSLIIRLIIQKPSSARFGSPPFVVGSIRVVVVVVVVGGEGMDGDGGGNSSSRMRSIRGPFIRYLGLIMSGNCE